MKITKRSTALIKLAQDGSKLSNCSDEIKNERDLVLIAVKNNGIALLYAEKKFRDDHEMVREAVKTYGDILGYLNNSFCSDKTIALVAVENSPLVVEYLSEELRNDKDIAKVALNQDGAAMEFFNQKIKCNIELALSAVNNNWEAIQFVDPVLFKSKSLRLAAINGFLNYIEKYNHYYPSKQFDFADLYNEWLDDRDIAILLSKHISISNLNDELRSDKELILLIFQDSPYGYDSIGPELHNDKEVALQVIKSGITPKLLFAFLAAELKEDKDILYNLVSNYPDFYKKLPKRFKDDEDFVMLATSLDGDLYSYLPTRYRLNKKVVLNSIRGKYSLNINLIPHELLQLEDIQNAIKADKMERMKSMHPGKYFLEEHLTSKPDIIEYTDYRDGGKLKLIKPAVINPVEYNENIQHKEELEHPHQLKFICLSNYSDNRYFYVKTNIVYRNYDYNTFKELTPFSQWQKDEILEWKFVVLRFRYPPFSCEYDYKQKLKDFFKNEQEQTLDIIKAVGSYDRSAMSINLELSHNSTFYDSYGNPLCNCDILLEGFFARELKFTKKFIFHCLGISLVPYTDDEMKKYLYEKAKAEAEIQEEKRLLEIKKAKMITKDKRIEIVKMVNEGMSYHDIAKVFDVDHSTIIRHYQKALKEK